MRKLAVCIFAVLLLLFSAAVPAGAEDVKEGLKNFILTANNLGEVELLEAEYAEFNLENLGLHVTVLMWVTNEEDYRKGQAGYVVERNEYLADDALNALLEEERNLAQAEYQELQNLAGKMDVSLYKQLQESSADAVFEVYIFPVYRLTAELEQQITYLYKEYEIELPEDVDYGRDTGGFQGVDGGGTSGSPGSVEPAYPVGIPEETPPSDPIPEPVPDPAPEDQNPAAGPCVIADPDAPVSSSDEIKSQYPNEFYTALNELYAKGYDEAVASLTAYLDENAIPYRVEPSHVIVTVTPAQAMALRDREDVAWIGSYEYIAVEDMAVPPTEPGSYGQEPALDADLIRTTGKAESAENNTSNGFPWIWAGSVVGLVALGAFLILRK